jgi:hypothetical protein
VASANAKEQLWLACRDKTCCYTRFVTPTGLDVWRIARTLDVPVWSFATYFKAPEDRPDAFALDSTDRRFCLLLNKRRSRRTKTPPPCTFLLRTRRGYHRCALGELRPRACQAYPAELAEEVVCLRLDGGCTCRRWALADVDIAAERALVTARRSELHEYCAIVDAWNAHVAGGAPPDETDFVAFCSHLLRAYDERVSA